MKILHFYKSAYPGSVGGVEQVIHQLAKGTALLGHEVDVLSLGLSESVYPRNIDGYRLHQSHANLEIASTPFSYTVFKRFRELAREADIIHYHFPYPFADVLHFLTRVKKPSLVTYHSDIVKQKYLVQIYRPLKRQFLKSMNRIVATSPHYLATSEVLVKFKEKCSVIPLGLNEADFPVPSTDLLETWRARLPERFFLFVGVLRYYKGLHILLEATQGTDFPIVIVGGGPEEGRLKKQARELGLHNVYFLGPLSDEDKIALLSLCYGVVFPSHLRSEAFGISLLEGAMFGKPLISAEIGTGTSYINQHNVTGIVVPPHDPMALRRALEEIWNDKTRAEAMGNAAKSRYRSLFTAEKMIEAYLELYQRLVNQ